MVFAKRWTWLRTPSRPHVPSFKMKAMQPEMGRQITIALYVVAMAAVIVGVDFAFFRNRFWERLTVNIGIVLVFAAFYLRFLKR
jgi:protein-S-isoprenylcysteine O-methyltransferase Ste14